MRNLLKSSRLPAMLLPAALIPAMAFADFLTPTPPMITLEPTAPAGSSVTAIISSGDTVGAFLFEGLPDGIGLAPAAGGSRVDVFVTHEQTSVPFFGRRDFQDASISRLTLNTMTAAVTNASVALPPSEGFLRLCSAFMAGPAEGFSTYTLFTGEESNDIVDIPAGATSYGSDPALAPQRQAGYAVALDTASGAYTTVPGLGRLNHENTIVVPIRPKKLFALLTTDDTFSAPSGQLYLYLARRESDIWMDNGSLWAFQVTRTQDGAVDSTDPFNGANDYLDIHAGDDWQGQFIRVPEEIARGQTGQAPQDALERWSNENNVFQFIRLEDLTYDQNTPQVVYIADTGTSRVVPDATTGRMQRGPSGTVGLANNGRIFRMEFNRRSPRRVDSFSILADGDDTGSPVYVPFTHPDNMDTSSNSLMVQEDTTDAKIWRRDAATGTWSVIASVLDPNGESSGIVDASQWFGAGSWLLNVQGHGSNVIEVVVGGVALKRESGQLLLLKVPGS